MVSYGTNIISILLLSLGVSWSQRNTVERVEGAFSPIKRASLATVSLEVPVTVDDQLVVVAIKAGDDISLKAMNFCTSRGISINVGCNLLEALFHRNIARNLRDSRDETDDVLKGAQIDAEESHWRRVIELQPDSTADLVELGRTLEQHPLNGPTKAQDVYDKAVSLDPKNPHLLLVAGGNYQKLGFIEKAIPLYRACLECTSKNDAGDTTKIAGIRGNAHHNLGLALLSIYNTKTSSSETKSQVEPKVKLDSIIHEVLINFEAAAYEWAVEGDVEFISKYAKNKLTDTLSKDIHTQLTEQQRKTISRVGAQWFFMSDLFAGQFQFTQAAELFSRSLRADAMASLSITTTVARQQMGISADVRGDQKQRPKRLTIFCPIKGEWGDGTWGPSSIDTTGIGGSEEAVILLSRELSEKGYDVRVYAYLMQRDFGRDEHGVLWLPLLLYDAATDATDIFISWRSYRSILLAPETCKLRFIWLHIAINTEAIVHADLLSKLSGVFVVSEKEKSRIPIETFSQLDAHGVEVIISPNGLDPKYFAPRDVAKDKVRKSARFIYSSQPNYGLEPLLIAWPFIIDRLPHASLEVYNKFPNSYYSPNARETDPFAMMRWRESVERRLKQPGITYHGMVDQSTLAIAFAHADFWLYPTSTPETSCITAMKAQAMGAIPITSRFTNSALPETCGKFDLGPHEPLLNTDNEKSSFNPMLNDPERIKIFADAVVAAVLKSPDSIATWRFDMIQWARATFSWEHTANIWKESFERISASQAFINKSNTNNESFFDRSMFTELEYEIINLRSKLADREKEVARLKVRLRQSEL